MPAGGYPLVCHCWLIERADRLVLIDSGIGLHDIADPTARLGERFIAAGRPQLDPTETAARHVESLGFARTDVRDIVLTHLDLDHAGGIADFPHARVHVNAVELNAALHPTTRNEILRYRTVQWQHGPQWESYDTVDAEWLGMSCLAPLRDLPPEIFLVNLPGHSRGHCGVAVITPGGPRLHTGDAYIDHRQFITTDGPCPRTLLDVERFVCFDATASVATHARLQTARTVDESLVMCCAHDGWEFTP